jgi:hypothetical protein
MYNLYRKLALALLPNMTMAVAHAAAAACFGSATGCTLMSVAPACMYLPFMLLQQVKL